MRQGNPALAAAPGSFFVMFNRQWRRNLPADILAA